MFQRRPLRFGGERIGRWSIPQALVFLGHDDSCVLSADLAKVNDLNRSLDAARIFERSDFEGLGMNGADGGSCVCRIFGFGGLVGRGLRFFSERTAEGGVTYNPRFFWVGFRIGFITCCEC